MFMFLFADLQYFFIGAIFLFSGIRKIISDDASMISIHSVLSKILKRPLITKLTYQAIGFIELIVGLLLLLPYSYPWSIYLATIIIVGFVGYDFFGIKITPGRPCGCMGWSEDSVSWRTIIRSILLLALCMLGWQSRYFWFDTYKTNILICSLIMVSQFSLLIVISPEIMANIRKMLHNSDRSVTIST